MKFFKYTAFLFLIITLGGCATARYTDSIQPRDLAELKDRKSSIEVLANVEEWRNSGVLVKKGARYKIETEGQWRVGVFCPFGNADGAGCSSLPCLDLFHDVLVQDRTICTLVAKIGENGVPFAIGGEYVLDTEEDGVLFFRINERVPVFDNLGTMTVNTVIIDSAPGLAGPKKNDLLASDRSTLQPAQDDDILARRAQGWAVVIGISDYQFSGQNGLENLIFADNDAESFISVLKKLGWNQDHIRLLLNKNATKRNIEIALESWLTKAGGDDRIVLFWAGHGFPDPEDPEKVYFATYDTDLSIPATGYRMDRVRDALEERKAKNTIIFADTCNAGKIITRGERGIAIVPQINKMRREGDIPKGWIFMVGADTDRQAIEHTSWTNGAFTHSLVKGLQGEADGYESAGLKDGIVTMGELRTYLNSAMPELTQRVLGVAKRPIITTSSGDPHIWTLDLRR